MSYLSEVEKKQRLIEDFDGFTFEYTRDLSGEIIIHPPTEYNEEMLCSAVGSLINMFLINTYNKLEHFTSLNDIKFKIIKA